MTTTSEFRRAKEKYEDENPHEIPLRLQEIRTRRKALGISQGRLGQWAGLNQTEISVIERNAARLGFFSTDRYYEALGWIEAALDKLEGGQG